MRNIRRMVPVLWRSDRGLFLATGLLTILRSGFPTLTLLLTRSLVDGVTRIVAGGEAAGTSLPGLLALLAGVEIASAIAGNWQDLVTLKLTQKVEHDLQLELMNRATQLPLSEFARPAFYDRLQQARNGLSFRGVKWLEQAATFVRSGAALAGLLVIMAKISPWLGVVICIPLLPTIWVQMRFGKLRFFQMRFQTPAFRRMVYTGDLLTGQQGAAEVRLFGTAGYLKSEWRRHFWQNANETFGLRRRGAGVNLALDAGNILLSLTALLVLVVTSRTQGLSVGDYVLVLQAVPAARAQIQGLAGTIAQMFEDALFLTDLFGFLTLVPQREPAPEVAQRFPVPLKRGIKVSGLSFRYPESPVPALHQVSFSIRPGERVAIVGENGSGKSTLVKCLLGLYPADEGSVQFDGADIRSIDPGQLRANVTAIFQDFVPYQMTVRENVTLGDIERCADTGRLQQVLRSSGADEVAARLPQGVDTPLGAMFSGIDLSRGQWQKLAMARLLFRDGQVIALDEPTAALDPTTEAMVYGQFAQLAAGRTTLMVSHRLGICRMADRILVLKHGELIEEGTHDELIRQDGEYARMYQLQASWYSDALPPSRGESMDECHVAG